MQQKEKIAISLSKELLKLIDGKIDGSVVRSRSQAIEMFVRKGIESNVIDTAVIMLSRRHHDIALSNFKGSSLIKKQIEIFNRYGINNIFVLTQSGDRISDLREECDGIGKVIVTNAKKNADALKHLKDDIKRDFFVMSGDIFIDFDIDGMIRKHTTNSKVATIGLMSRGTPSKYGAAVLDGDLVIDFKEKPKNPITHVVNSGIYLFKPDVFGLLKGKIEDDVLPKLAKTQQLIGFFTTGEYVHFDEI